MVLRHLLIASQFQLLDSPSILSPSRPGANRLLGSPGTAGGTADEDDAVIGFIETAAASVGTGAGAIDKAVGRVPNNHPMGPGSGSKSSGVGKEAESVEGTGDGEADGVGRHRDWIGTSSDAFEVAIAVLKVLCYTYRGGVVCDHGCLYGVGYWCYVRGCCVLGWGRI